MEYPISITAIRLCARYLLIHIRGQQVVHQKEIFADDNVGVNCKGIVDADYRALMSLMNDDGKRGVRYTK